MRTGLNPRNLSGRLYYIPHTKKYIYREMCLIKKKKSVHFSYTVALATVSVSSLYSQDDHICKSKD